MEQQNEGKIDMSVRFLDGTNVSVAFRANIQLKHVANWVSNMVLKDPGLKQANKLYLKVYERKQFLFTDPLKTEYHQSQWDGKTIQELFGGKGCALIVRKMGEQLHMEKCSGSIYDAKMTGDAACDYSVKLRPGSVEDKEAFEKKQVDKEVEEKRKEREKKKQDLAATRRTIEGNKEDRKDKQWVPNAALRKENEYL